jgi:methyl-accepting chemotaxis protein
MKLKFRLSIIVMAILIVVVVAVVSVTIVNGSAIQLTSTTLNEERLAENIALECQRRYEGYLQTAHNLASIMGDYANHAPENRRVRFMQTMKTLMERNTNIVAIYAVWKPNVLDDMDAEYAGQLGSSAEGQFIPQYTRETGTVELRSYAKYQQATISGEEQFGEPEARTINGKPGSSFHFRVPIFNFNGQNELVGIVGVSVDIAPNQTIVQSVLTNPEKYTQVAAVAIYSNKGIVIGHFDAARVGKSVEEADAHLYGDFLPQVLPTIQGGKIQVVLSYSAALKTNLRMVMVPLVVGGMTTTPWSVMVGIDEKLILKNITAMALFTGLLVLVAIAIAAVITFILISRITKPIVDISLTLKDIAEGEGDLTKTITISSKDEIGDLAKYFNQSLATIKNLVVTIKKQAVALFDIGNELSSNMTETAAAINEITANIQSIKSRVNNQSLSVTSATEAMEQITININKLNEHIERQSSSVSESSSSIEEMLASIQSVTKTMNQNDANVRELADASEVGRTGLQEVATDIQEIAKESEGLLEINAVMQNIASQTNLLSMNAAIEAAHAGEVGKGFAVVADEIRKLAENSSEQSKSISVVLKKIADSISKITKSTDAVLNKFEAIDGGVRTVSEQQGYVSANLEELNVGSKRILDTLGQLNDITIKVKGGSSEMLRGSKDVISESQKLEMVTQEIANGMNEMASGANQINIAVDRVNTVSVSNRENIDILVKEIAKFKVE